MIKLKELLTESLQGEWWFQDGQAIFADGDVGDMNHEGYVLDILKREVLDELGADISSEEGFNQWDEYADEIFEHIGDQFDETERQRWSEGFYLGAIASYIKRAGSPELKEKFVYAFSQNKDAREYALIHWGWQRVKRNIIQTQTLTHDDLRHITGGLYDAYGEEIESDPEITFNIEVMSTRSWYTGIPWDVLKTDDPSALNDYRERY